MTVSSRSRKSGSSALAPTRVKQVSGTPQARCRDKTQSGRFSIIENRRLRPFFGVHSTSSSIDVKARLVDGGEPLRSVQADHRRLRPPRMRVGNRDPGAGQQRADLDQLVDDGLVRAARLAVRLQDRLAAEQRQIGAVAAVSLDIEGHLQPVLQADLIVVIAVAGRRVDKARARVVGDVIAGEQGHVVVPFAVRPLCPAQGVGADQRGKFIGWHVAHPRPHAIFQPRRCQRGPGQRVGQQIAVADIRPAFVRRAGHLIETVGDAGTEADRAVLRQGPGRGGPDDHFGTEEFLSRCNIRKFQVRIANCVWSVIDCQS